jgi:hypothetical protein
MNVKIIESKDTELGTPIIWDCFRGTYTHLMCTVCHVIKCQINVELCGVTPEITLLFQMFNTNGSQQSTRKVVGSSVFNLDYKVQDVKDETLLKYFKKFWNDYISNEDSKMSNNNCW